jgi:HEAT repeat protein
MGRRAEPALAPLVAALSDKDKTVCSQAARALGRIGVRARSAVPRLTALSRDPDVLVSREAEAALQSIGRDPS